MPEKLRRSPFGPNLRVLGLKRIDVIAFSRTYGRSDADAAQFLIDVGIRGKRISAVQGMAFFTGNNITRAEAARKYYISQLGEPQNE